MHIHTYIHTLLRQGTANPASPRDAGVAVPRDRTAHSAQHTANATFEVAALGVITIPLVGVSSAPAARRKLLAPTGGITI